MMSLKIQRLVGIPACYDSDDTTKLPFHRVYAPYVDALINHAHVLPVIIPALGHRLDIHALLERLDGVCIPGSESNIEPWRYHGQRSPVQTLHDYNRDATTLPLIPEIIQKKIPLLTICRGTQELNVALGGTLHQRLQNLPGKLDHRARSDQSTEQQFAPVHTIHFSPQSLLRQYAEKSTATVNSLHEQGIDKLGDNLIVEAEASDGVIEAVRLDKNDSFVFGFQWHPEWRVEENRFHQRIFHAFGQAVTEYSAQR